jgi:hypothetical protein
LITPAAQKEMTHGRMQVERMVRLIAMEEHRDRDDGDVGQKEARGDVAPPGEIKYTGKKHPIHFTPHHSRLISHASPGN